MTTAPLKPDRWVVMHQTAPGVAWRLVQIVKAADEKAAMRKVARQYVSIRNGRYAATPFTPVVMKVTTELKLEEDHE